MGGAVAVITNITGSDFSELVAPLCGRDVASVWLSDHTALYLEIGAILEAYDSGRPRGEYSIYLGFDWRFEFEQSSLSSTAPGAKTGIASLLSGQLITDVSTIASFELDVRFESGARIRSADRDADAEWTVYLPSGRCIGANAGSLVVESESASVVA